jgi:hypothetical protein
MLDYKSIEIDTALLLETLRNIQSYRRLTPNDSSTFRPNRNTSSLMIRVADSRIKRVQERFESSLSGLWSGWGSFKAQVDH